MAEKVDQINMDPLDTTETDKWVGKPLGGGQLKEPITLTDIRRWAQGMQNPNPLYYDEQYAAQSAAGEILAPQSFTVNCTVGHGAVPAIQGYIPGTHMLFGGDEWWFYGPRIRPGDKIRSDRMLFDYRVTQYQVRRADDVLARRHHLHQPARRGNRQGTLHLDPLSRRERPRDGPPSPNSARRPSGRSKTSTTSRRRSSTTTRPSRTT